MSELWASFLTTRIGRWIVGIGAVIAAIAVAVLVAFVKGKHAQADTDKAKDAGAAQQAAQEVTDAANTRQEVDNATAKLPDAPTQTVATADPASAAGELRDDGWMRPGSSQDGH
jgi:gas vesicle protein